MSITTTSETLKLKSLQLFQAYRERQSIDLRNKIIELNFGLVRKEAYYWANQCQENYEDLLQVGSLGLIRAIERFSIAKGNAFSSFAIPYIRGEIQHYLRDKSDTIKIPRRWVELKRKAALFTVKHQQQHSCQPTDIEIAQQLNIPLHQWQEIKIAHKNREPLSLDMKVNDEQEGNTCLGDLVADPRYRSFQLAQEDQIRLQNALSELEDRTRKVLEFVFLQDLTQKQTAEKLGISVVTVARRVKKGLTSLKKSMSSEAYE